MTMQKPIDIISTQKKNNAIVEVNGQRYLVGMLNGKYTGYDGYPGTPIYKVREAAGYSKIFQKKINERETLLFVRRNDERIEREPGNRQGPPMTPMQSAKWCLPSSSRRFWIRRT
ncbi:MAG: hypothetical protein NTX79_00565 [Candidatus Micrarchaeota archaeon]|nr:hypothetical protein [Candidatus Micrarchaeota archaeon]